MNPLIQQGTWKLSAYQQNWKFIKLRKMDSWGSNCFTEREREREIKEETGNLEGQGTSLFSISLFLFFFTIKGYAVLMTLGKSQRWHGGQCQCWKSLALKQSWPLLRKSQGDLLDTTLTNRRPLCQGHPSILTHTQTCTHMSNAAQAKVITYPCVWLL